MPRISLGINLDDIESGFATIPNGTYLFKVRSVKASKGKTSKKSMLVWSYEVVEPEEFKGKVIADFTSLQHDALWKLKALLVAAGTPWERDEFDYDDCIGQEFVGVVVQEDYEGRPRNRIESYHPVSDGLETKIDEEGEEA